MSTKKGCINKYLKRKYTKYYIFIKQGAYNVKDFNIDADLLPRFIKSSRFSFLLETFIEENSKMVSIAFLKFYGDVTNLSQKRG